MKQLMVERMQFCPLCRGERIKKAFSIRFEDLFCGLTDNFTYEQEICYCEDCHMIYSKNPVDSHTLDMHYKRMSVYESAKIVGEKDSGIRDLPRSQFDFIHKNIDDYESVLEIGAATGYSLSLYKKMGKKVKGIEPSVTNKKFCKEQYGIDLVDKTFDEWEAEAGNEQYDLVFMSHVLEHIVSFRSTIEKIERFHPKYFFIEVPCIESKGKGLEPFGMITPEHVNLFGKDSLNYLMSQNGYMLLACDFPINGKDMEHAYPTIMTLWKKTKEKYFFEMETDPGKALEDYYRNTSIEFEKVKDVINAISDNAKLAVWGTGLHTARLLGMTSLRDKNIVKFYDSDIRKHNMTMEGRQIKAFRAEDIEKGEVDTILISSYASKNTIKETILKNTNGRFVNIIDLYH